MNFLKKKKYIMFIKIHFAYHLDPPLILFDEIFDHPGIPVGLVQPRGLVVNLTNIYDLL